MRITLTTEEDGRKFTFRMDKGLTSLTKAKCNEYYMMDDGYEDFWVISKNVLDGKIKNIDFQFKVVDGERTLIPDHVTFWDYDDTIDRDDLFSVKVYEN